MARRRRRLLTSNQKRLTDTWPSGTTPTFVFSSSPLRPLPPPPAPPARRRPLNVTSGRQRPDYTSADPGDEFEINDVAAAGDPQRMFVFAASGEDPPNTAAVTQAATHLGGQLHPPRPAAGFSESGAGTWAPFEGGFAGSSFKKSSRWRRTYANAV